MKNKRKGDAEPDNPSLNVRKKLMKLKTISKPENPVVTEIKQKVSEVVESRKKANNIVDIIGHLEVTEPVASATAAINGVKRIFTIAVEKEQMKKQEDGGDGEVSDEDKYKHWMYDMYREAVKKLCTVLHHPKKNVSELALVTVMNLLVTRHNKAAKDDLTVTSWTDEDQAVLQSVILALCSTKTTAKTQIQRFQEYFDNVDVKFYFLQLLAKIVAKAVKTSRTTPVFLDNVLTCLEMVGMIGKEEEDSVTLLCHDSTDRDVTTFSLDIKLMKRHFEAVWLKFLNCKLTQDQYRRVLVILHDKVLPHLPRPLLLTDFLLSSYEMGGSISLLSLSGVFTLVQQHNLEYPDFYKKLYALFDPSVLHVKYKARFFHLADIFLTSSHLPEYLVAAFAKRLARIALQAPANSLVMCLDFIKNLIIRHRGLTRLLHDPLRQDVDTDPFVEDDPDPATCRAVESSLWEVQTLAEHALPQVSAVAKQLLKAVGDQEADVSASLETTWQDMMDAELKRKVWINVPLNYERPTGLKLPKNDILSDMFAMT